MKDFIGAVFGDGDESDFKAVQGKRIKAGHANFSKPMSVALVCILALALAPIRIVAKFFQRSTRIARLNREGMVRPHVLMSQAQEDLMLFLPPSYILHC